MKISHYSDEKINIYCSEMSSETVESYERYYKNLNDCQRETNEEIKMDSNEKSFVENKENDLYSEEKNDLTSASKHNIDLDRKRVKNVYLEPSFDPLPCKKRKKDFEPPKLQEANRDIFCWRCHKFVAVGDVIPCYFCPRVFHLKCAHIQEKPSAYWLCTECDAINSAENPDKIPPALSKLQKKDLAELLMYVIKRMRQHEGSPHFENSVDPASYPDYKDYIVKPMYLSLLEHSVKNLKYASCESFLADTKWMVHNSYVFNTVHSELTLYAKAMMKNAKHECDEIINCPDCYLHANTLDEDKWFIEPCEKPHVLVWARLKGFPYWPCKVMKTSGSTVDVRFFGDHNKSLVPVDCCYLYSKQMPSKQKKVDELGVAIKEASLHIKRLEERFHVFQYAPVKTLYNPKQEEEQRKLLLPYHDQQFLIKVKDKEKLLDPEIVKNVYEEPFSNYNYTVKLEEKNKNMSALPNRVDIDNKNIIKNLVEEIPVPKDVLINKSTTSPLTKPKIIIEESDSDILSNGSCIVPRQFLRGYENFNPTYIHGSKFIEKQIMKPKSQPIKETASKTVNVVERINCFRNSCFNNENQHSNHSSSEENFKSVNSFKDINFHSEKVYSDGEKKNSLPEQPNTIPSLDKSDKKNISDKLKITSNAQLISVITDNPALITNYMFKPMVVLQKLKDEVFRDHSNYISKKTELVVSNKLSALNQKNLPKPNENSEQSQLNLDLLNGNITNFVSMTEVDLDKDGSLSDTNGNKEAENVICYPLETNNNVSKACIKSEQIEDGEDPIDYDYIEMLSKSILESTFVCNKKTENKPQNEALIKETSCEEVSSIENRNLAYFENEQNSLDGNEKNLSDDIETTLNHKNGEKNCHSPQGNSGVNTEFSEMISTQTSNSGSNDDKKCNSLAEYHGSNMCEKVAHLNVNEFELKTNGNRSDNLIKNQMSLKNTGIVLNKGLRENISPKIKNDCSCPVTMIESSSNIESKVFPVINLSTTFNQKEGLITSESEIGSTANLERYQNNMSENHTESNIKKIVPSSEIVIKEGKNLSKDNLDKEAIVSNKKGISDSVNDSDCEIVNIVFPENGAKILKPIGYKKGKITGRIIKRGVMKNGLILPGCRKRHSLGMSLKRNDDHSQSKFPLKGFRLSRLSNNCLKISSKSNSQSYKFKKICNVKHLHKKSPNSIDQITRVQEENKMMSLDIEEILSKVKELNAEGNIVGMLRGELKKFVDQEKKRFESYKSAFIEEMDSLYNMEKQRWIQESMNVCKNESEMMVDEIKKKLWCILCLNEAKFHCCWSTSYCSEKCQLADWPVHMKTCTQYEMRVGDPDVHFSPDFKQMILREPEAVRGLKFKDLINKPIESPLKPSVPSCSTSVSDIVNATAISTNSASNNMPTSSKSTVFIPKSVVKQDVSQASQETSRNQLVKINQAVHSPGVSSLSSQTRGIVHVPKKSYLKPNNTQNSLPSLHNPYS